MCTSSCPRATAEGECCPWVVVLSPQEAAAISVGFVSTSGVVDMGDIARLLPINAVLARRGEGAALPADVEHGSRSSLLGKNVEILLRAVRFELPPGVKVQHGATLGRGVQLSPGTILNRDLEVAEWPRGMALPPGTELVKLTNGCDMPVGFEIVPMARADKHLSGLPKNYYYTVRLPHLLKLPTAQQLAEEVTVVTGGASLTPPPAADRLPPAGGGAPSPGATLSSCRCRTTRWWSSRPRRRSPCSPLGCC